MLWIREADSREGGKRMKGSYKLAVRQYKKRCKAEKRKDYTYAAEMEKKENIIEVRGLQTWFYTDKGIVKSVEDISFDIPAGKTVGLVGESGCGKSVTSLSVMRLLPEPKGQIAGGEIRFCPGDGSGAIDLAKTPEKRLEQLRGSQLAMIFQEPMTSLNPVFSIGDQLDECVQKQHPEADKKKRREMADELLKKVGITRKGIYDNYPYELSGGMRQRVMIAMALAGDPKLLIADEPTTALDVTIQAQILDLMRTLKEEINSSVLLITHDLGVIAEMADYVIVMYAGKIVEQGTAEEIFEHKAHPYTRGLMQSKPVLNQETEELYSIPGNVPDPLKRPEGCYFSNRCQYCTDLCQKEYPAMQMLSQTHQVSCHFAGRLTEGSAEHGR